MKVDSMMPYKSQRSWMHRSNRKRRRVQCPRVRNDSWRRRSLLKKICRRCLSIFRTGSAQSLTGAMPESSCRRPERLDYLGTSFGLTLELYNFWHKAGYLPVYIRQTRSEVTGEHTVIMMKPVKSDSGAVMSDWLCPFVSDFRRRFCTLLGLMPSSSSSSLTMCDRGSVPRDGSCASPHNSESQTHFHRHRNGPMHCRWNLCPTWRWITTRCLRS